MDTHSDCPASLRPPSFAEPHLPIGSPRARASVRPLSLPSDPSSGTTLHVKTIAHGLRKRRKNVLARGERYRHSTAIGTLPDDVLLEIFDFYRNNYDYTRRPVWNWHLLVHVCRRWRQIVFSSPNRLSLEILCTHRTPVAKNLDTWPAFPIAIDYQYSGRSTRPKGEGNIIAALEHSDRVCFVRLDVTSPQVKQMITLMQKPFPVLTHLNIALNFGGLPVLPSAFLGGSAPRLQEFTLYGISYPALPMLLLSANDLVELDLRRIPPDGYISPEAMVTCLAASPRLEIFVIKFQFLYPLPDRSRPPPRIRTVLPALTTLKFEGAIEYLEDFVARIDSPKLDRIKIVYLIQRADFQLSEFIDRSIGPKLTLLRHAEVTLFYHKVSFDMYHDENHPHSDGHPAVTISYKGYDWEISHMAPVLSRFSTLLSNAVHLKLKSRPRRLELGRELRWQNLLLQFPTVQTLHVSRELAERVALELEDIPGEMVSEMLPSLDFIRMVGQPASSIEKFVGVRRLSGRPVTVVDTDRAFDERIESYLSM